MPTDRITENLALSRQLKEQLKKLCGAEDPVDESRSATSVQVLLRELTSSLELLQALNQVSQRDDELLHARELLIAFARQRRPQPKPGIPDHFDEDTYLALYPDVAAYVKAGTFRSGYDHWVTVGEKEGRIATYTNPPGIPADFDESGYLALNPDVAEDVSAGLYASGYEHWKLRGIKEWRSTRRPGDAEPGRGYVLDTSIPPSFDEDAYLLFNPDIAEAVRKRRYTSGYEHWVKHGRLEHRRGIPVETAPDRSAFLAEMQARPMGVNLYGFVSTASGLGSVARGCIQAFDSQSIAYNIIDVPPWKGGIETRALPDFKPYRVNLIQQNADVFERFLHAYGVHLLNGAYNIGYWLWELPSVRPEWFHVYQYVDEIWVASEFCRHALQAATALPVKRVPLVVDNLESKAIYGRDHFKLPNDVFVFCYVFDISSYVDRKNPFCLIEAFKREFGKSCNVLLYLKYFNTSHDESQTRKLKEAVRGAPNIRTYSDLFSDEEIVSLHNAVDCFVSPHRSEGFGFNLAESMYFGKPVIGTRYASTLDFMNDKNSYLIDCKLVPIQESAGPYVKGSVWADPSTEHLSYLMRRVFENSAERAEKGRLAARTIRENYNAQAAGKLMQQRFVEIGIDQPRLSRAILKQHSISPETRLFRPQTPRTVLAAIRRLTHKPVISVITPVYNVPPEHLRACIESVRAQWYPFWELCLCDDASTDGRTKEVLASYQGTDARIKIVYSDRNLGIAGASNRAVEISTGEYLAMLDNDDEITPDALFEIAKAVDANTAIDFLYCDEDKIEENGEYSDHYFKPDWSPDHLRSVMYVLHMLVVRKDLFFEVGCFRLEFSGAQDYDLALRLSSQARAIHHIPKILYHWRKIPGSAAAVVDAKPRALDAARRALEDHVQQRGIDATVENGKLTGHYRVRYAIQGNPLVSLCIPTHDTWSEVKGRGKINLVENFVKSIAAKTDYKKYEILVCDDANISERTRRALRDIDYRLLNYRDPAWRQFNFSRKANFMFKHARGNPVVLLNDDMEVISPEWLGALIEFAQQEEIGATGGRLLFPNGRVQHVGVVLGVNDAVAHVYHSFPADLVGYNGITHIIRNYSAVTGACLATRKEVLEHTGGFDEGFPIDYNDIDYCLKALECGYRVVYTPYCELYHFEGQFAVSPAGHEYWKDRTAPNPESTRVFRQRWAKYVENDPYYNPNLTRVGVDFAAAAPNPAIQPVLQKQTQLAL